MITRPTLFWLYNSSADGKQDLRVGYQTSGLSWNAEYVGVLNEAETSLGLSGWSSINNQSGKTYENATLKLIAGDISRAQDQLIIRGGRSKEVTLSAMAPGFEEKQFFEYHMYTLPRKATVADKEIKQLSLFDPATSAVRKVYMYKPEENIKQVAVVVKFKNSQQTGLGMPLPRFEAARRIASAVGYLALDQQSQVTVYPFSNRLEHRMGPWRGKSRAGALLRQLSTLPPPAGATAG